MEIEARPKTFAVVKCVAHFEVGEILRSSPQRWRGPRRDKKTLAVVAVSVLFLGGLRQARRKFANEHYPGCGSADPNNAPNG